MALVGAAEALQRRRLYAAAMTLAMGIPALSLLGWTLWHDWSERQARAPLRALLGDELEAQLRRGARTPKHYLGNSRPAPDVTLHDAQGRPWRLRDRQGRRLLLNFWSITCRPCLEELPSLAELASLQKDQLEVVAVSVDEDAAAALKVVPPGSPLKVLFDPKRQVVTGRFGTKQFPETWLIDQRGIMRLRLDGPQPWSSALMLDVLASLR